MVSESETRRRDAVAPSVLLLSDANVDCIFRRIVAKGSGSVTGTPTFDFTGAKPGRLATCFLLPASSYRFGTAEPTRSSCFVHPSPANHGWLIDVRHFAPCIHRRRLQGKRTLSIRRSDKWRMGANVRHVDGHHAKEDHFAFVSCDLLYCLFASPSVIQVDGKRMVGCHGSRLCRSGEARARS